MVDESQQMSKALLKRDEICNKRSLFSMLTEGEVIKPLQTRKTAVVGFFALFYSREVHSFVGLL